MPGVRAFDRRNDNTVSFREGDFNAVARITGEGTKVMDAPAAVEECGHQDKRRDDSFPVHLAGTVHR